MRESGLPIDSVLPELRAVLESHGGVVLQAPPGAGKSTVVPLALLDAPWARGQRLIMLEPRRLAARAVAQRMAQTLREPVGQTVGYRMRLDTRVSRDTRIEVVTEGVLTRMLQTDPSLEGVAAVIFDEFHERSLQADLGLALALDARENLAPDLKLIVMSATLDGERVAALLGDAPVVTAQGRMFPVETRYAGKGAPVLPDPTAARGQQESPERVVAQIVATALAEEPGDVLVFLPGAREIRRVQSLLEERLSEGRLSLVAERASPARATETADATSVSQPAAPSSGRRAGARAVGSERDPRQSLRILPLFGDLSASEQDAALAPSQDGARKVVLATNIAETSLTIEGVRVVVDSGLVRRSVFDPSTGMSRLETQRISRASADQRQGRAGRVAPGVCYRAWSEGAQRSLAPFTAPEITDADLVPLALDLANWGVRDATALRWLDVPPAAMLASARDLLAQLGALDRDGRITPHGREMAQLGVHPRLAHMLLRGRSLGAIPLAADLAALLSERDVLRGAAGARDADIRSRLDVFRSDRVPQGIDRGALERARRMSRDLARRLANGGGAVDAERTAVGSASASDPRRAAVGPASAGDPERATAGSRAADVARTTPGYRSAPTTRTGGDVDVGVLLALAYPDRIGRRRAGGEGRYTLANGRGAHFADVQSLARQEFIVAVDLDDRERDARILLAAPLSRADLEEHFADRLRRAELVEWNSREQAVNARRVVQLDALVVDEQPLPQPPADATRAAMLAGIREMGLDVLPWTREARDLQARMEFVRHALAPEDASTVRGQSEARPVDQGGATTGNQRGAITADQSGATEADQGGVTEADQPHATAADQGDVTAGDQPAAAAGRRPAPPVANASDWPNVSDEALLASLDTWLAPWLDGITRRDHLARLPLADALRALLSWDQQKRLDELAPSHLEVPTGSRIRIDYLDESAPVVAVRLQEVFGLEDTPRLADGRVPITFKLLSPAQRPVQVTRDLAGFWRGSYAEVRKDMRGRYPKHYWPENPLEAEPTRGVRRRP
jgi:ATP-dependent helicase HrpB